ERELQAQLSHLQASLNREYLKANLDEKRIGPLEAERDKAYRAYEDLRREIRGRNPLYAELKYPEPAKLSEVQKMLPPDTMLVEYLCQRRFILIFGVSRDWFRCFLSSRAKEVEQQVKALRQAMTEKSVLDSSAHAAYVESAGRLFELLIQPVGALLPN